MGALTDINYVKALLHKYGFKFSKTLGQNFLIDDSVPRNIAEAAEIEDVGVLEIGPGIGTLTYELAKRAKKVVAVEIDKALLPVLGETLAGFDNVTVVSGDVLKLDLKALINEHFAGMRLCVCANLPYYITTPVIMALLEQDLGIDSITVMIQKEVAVRLSAATGTKDCGAVTYATEYYCRPKMLFDVPPHCFIPQPKVTSSVIKLCLRETPSVAPKNTVLMFALVKYAFAQRRKNILNAVFNGFGGKYTKQQIALALEKAGIDPVARGEAVALTEYADFADALCEI